MDPKEGGHSRLVAPVMLWNKRLWKINSQIQEEYLGSAQLDSLKMFMVLFAITVGFRIPLIDF